MERKDGGAFSWPDYIDNPSDYKCIFEQKILPHCNLLINGIYWTEKYPRVLTRAGVKAHRTSATAAHEGLQAVADVSCDIGGSVEFTLAATTIGQPFLLYNTELDGLQKDLAGPGVLLMSTDNLPAEFPRDASEHFSSKLLPLVPDFVNYDPSKLFAEQTVSEIVTGASSPPTAS